MSNALEEHDGKVSIGGRNIANLRLADHIDALAEDEQELETLVESLSKTCTSYMYKIEISVEKTNLMTNSANGIQREIKVKRQKLGIVTSFKYLGAVVSDAGYKPEILSRIAQATAALTQLKPICLVHFSFKWLVPSSLMLIFYLVPGIAIPFLYPAPH